MLLSEEKLIGAFPVMDNRALAVPKKLGRNCRSRYQRSAYNMVEMIGKENYMKRFFKILAVLCFCVLSCSVNAASSEAEEHYLTPYQTSKMKCYTGDAESFFSMMGQEFYYGVVPENWGDFKQVLYNLDGKFEKVTLSVGHWDNRNDASAKMYIYADEKLMQTVELYNSMPLQELSLNTIGVKQLRFQINQYGAFYGLGNVVGYGGHIYQSEITQIATPQKNGVRTYTCTGCGSSYEEIIAMPVSCTPYLSPYQTTNFISYGSTGDNKDYFCVMGEKIYQGIVPGNWGDKKEALYNLGKKYKNISFRVGHRDNLNNDCQDTKMYIYADGVLVKEVDLSTDMISKEITVNTEGVTQLRIDYNLYGAFYAIYDMQYTLVAEKEHNYQKEETVPATTEQEGICTYTCKDCGVSYIDVIEKLPSVEIPEVSLKSIALNETKLEMEKGKTFQLEIKKTPEDAEIKETIVWKSNNSSVATVSNGIVNAVGVGNCTISVQVGKLSANCSVSVKETEKKAELSVNLSEISANANGVCTTNYIRVNTNGTGGFTVDTGSCPWLRVADSNLSSRAASRITLKESGVFYLFVEKNESENSRTYDITVTHEKGTVKETVRVTQEAVNAILNVDTLQKTVDRNGKFYNNTVLVETKKTGSAMISVDASWLKVSSNNITDVSYGLSSLTMTGDGKVYLAAEPNTGEERTATITITHSLGSLSKEIEIIQLGTEGGYLCVDRESAYFDDPTAAIDGGPVTVTADEDTKWTATSSENWIQITKSQSLSAERYSFIESVGTGMFYIAVKENGTYTDRNGVVTISAPGQESYTIYVSQVKNEVNLVALLNESTVYVPRKTFGIKKSTKVTFRPAEGLYLSDISRITYSTSKKKVATIDKKGVIKGKKKGKAVISVTVRLEGINVSKKFKIRITVGKRNVVIGKITSQKVQ